MNVPHDEPTYRVDHERPAVTEYSILFQAGLIRINSLPHEISFGILQVELVTQRNGAISGSVSR